MAKRLTRQRLDDNNNGGDDDDDDDDNGNSNEKKTLRSKWANERKNGRRWGNGSYNIPWLLMKY